MKLSNNQIKRYSRQIILKNIGPLGQKKLLNSSVLVIGAGGLGSPALLYLSGLGIGKIGVIDHDRVDLSNLHRQILFTSKDINKLKSKKAKLKIKKINPDIKVKSFKEKLTKKNIEKIANHFEILVDGSDNFETKFLINDFCVQNKKILITGAINRYDGQVFTFNFKKRNSPCLRCFFQIKPSNELLNCETSGVIGPIAGIIGTIQANEVLKEILKIGKSLNGYVLIINALDLNFRKAILKKRLNCICNK